MPYEHAKDLDFLILAVDTVCISQFSVDDFKYDFVNDQRIDLM